MQNTNVFIKPNEQRKNKERSFYIAIANSRPLEICNQHVIVF